MSTTSVVKCDVCETVLNDQTKYPHSYALTLRCEDFRPPPVDGFTYDVNMEPLMKETAHFCNFDCLIEWLNKYKTTPKAFDSSDPRLGGDKIPNKICPQEAHKCP